jgi:hypothetical protein
MIAVDALIRAIGPAGAISAVGMFVLIAAVGAGAAVIIKFVAALARLMRCVIAFLTDWNGTEERPGVPARPGVLERLARIEILVSDDLSGTVARIEAKLDDHLCDRERGPCAR